MKNILAVVFILILAVFVFAQAPVATSLETPYALSNGNSYFFYSFNGTTIGEDSTTTVDNHINWSKPINISPFVGAGGGTGIIQMYCDDPDNDSVCVIYHWQVSCNPGSLTNTYTILSTTSDSIAFWTTWAYTDTLYSEKSAYTFYVPFDTLASFRYLRIGVEPENSADTTFINASDVQAWGWVVAPINAEFYHFDFDPRKDANRTFQDAGLKIE